MRVDKWLQVARVFKTRSKATQACNNGRVRVNGDRAKAHRALALDDRVEIEFDDDWKRILVVRELAERPLPKREVPRIFEDLSDDRPRLDFIDRILRRPAGGRDKGLGRPTKQDRREIDRLRGR